MLFILLGFLLLTELHSGEEQARWSAMDEAFTEHFVPYQSNPIGLKDHAISLRRKAVETGDCDLALVAQSLQLRALMMLREAPSLDLLSAQRLADCDPAYPRLAYDIGCFLIARDSLEAAEERLLLATRMPTWASHAWNMIGSARMQQGDLTGAATAWEQAHRTTLKHPNPSVLVNLGLVACRQNDWAKGQYWFNLAWEAHLWNQETQDYVFIEDIGGVIQLNLLRTAVNLRDPRAADAAWAQVAPTASTTYPLQQLRPMLDYALWRGGFDGVESLVRIYGNQLPEDSAEVAGVLNDRALLFSPWLDSSGWSLERAVEVLSTAERTPGASFTVMNQSNVPPELTVSKDAVNRWNRWMRGAVALLALLCLASIALWWRLERKNKAIERTSNAGLVELLRSISIDRAATWRTPLIINTMSARLQRTMLDGRVAPRKLAGLSERDVQVLEWVMNGQSSQQIAEQLGISVQRVYNIRSDLRTKLGLHAGQDWSDLELNASEAP